MVEAQFQTKFSLWLKYNNEGSAAYELKLTKDPSLPFNAVQPHQIRALQLAKHSKLIHKIADVGMLQKPFDCFILKDVPAYVVIQFWKPGEKTFFMIDVDKYVEEVEKSLREGTRKSLTPERAGIIGRVFKLV